FVAEVGTLLATRRRRSPNDPEVWAAQLAVVEGEVVGDLQFETDRARFIGRGHRIPTPHGVTSGRALSGTVGTVLDPIFSSRRRCYGPTASPAICRSYWFVSMRQRSLNLFAN